MSYLTRAEANERRESEAAQIAKRNLEDSILKYGPVLGRLFEAAIRVEGVPPEEIGRRKDAYLVGVWNELRTSFVSDDQEGGLHALKAINALPEHQLKTLSAELARLQVRKQFGS